MRIAVCISGHMRTYEQTYLSFQQHIFSKFDCDVFIVTYPTLGSKFSHMSNIDKNYPNVPININHIKSLYNPKDMAIIEDEEENSYYNPSYKGLQLGMFKAIKTCNDLKNQFGNYDLTIRIRPDINISKFDISKLDLKSINIPDVYKVHEGGITDQISIGTSDIMNVYCNYIENINEVSLYQTLNHPEIRLKTYLEKQGLKINYVDCDWNILRF